MKAGENDSASTSAIRADIESTRARMGETLEELGTRLNPERLKQQAKDAVHEATIGRVQTMARTTVDKAVNAGRSITDVVRENPIPAAMIVAGIGWLVWGGGRDKARAVAGTVHDATHRMSEGTTHVASNVASTITDTARTQSVRVAGAFDESPMALGAIALAAGMVAGFAIPSTQKESKLFGGARDDVVDKARELVVEKKEQLQHVAERVVTEARTIAVQAARDEGLTG